MKPLYSHLVELNLTGCTIGRGSLAWLAAHDNLQLLDLRGSHLRDSDDSNLHATKLLHLWGWKLLDSRDNRDSTDHDAAQVRFTLNTSTIC
jgi:hypothetical protein